MITMRPSDVPTYVEAGAADLGITGKDVLLEQSGCRRARARAQAVYELLDLGFGRCTMVFATADRITIVARIPLPRRCAGSA